MVESFPGTRSRRTTIRDVAEAAGVGVATVSRVFSGGPVSDETREKVLAAAARLDYRPSALGRNLRQRRRGGIGLLVPDITDGFYAGLADGVLACARSYGLSRARASRNQTSGSRAAAPSSPRLALNEYAPRCSLPRRCATNANPQITEQTPRRR